MVSSTRPAIAHGCLPVRSKRKSARAPPRTESPEATHSTSWRALLSDRPQRSRSTCWKRIASARGRTWRNRKSTLRVKKPQSPWKMSNGDSVTNKHSLLPGHDHRFRPVAGAHLAQDGQDVRAYGRDRDVEALGDLGVRIPFRQHAQHVELAIGQGLAPGREQVAGH